VASTVRSATIAASFSGICLASPFLLRSTVNTLRSKSNRPRSTRIARFEMETCMEREIKFWLETEIIVPDCRSKRQLFLHGKKTNPAIVFLALANQPSSVQSVPFRFCIASRYTTAVTDVTRHQALFGL
jgi:hypothetical protein